MTDPIRGASPGPTLGVAPPPPSDDAKLKKTAQQLEGVFVEQLFKAMRETVPQGQGEFDASSGEDMFTGLMDQHLAADTPTQWAHGLASAAYHQLRTSLPGAAAHAGLPNAAAPHAMTLAPPPHAVPLDRTHALPMQTGARAVTNSLTKPASR
jgi:flagellar protein FlgJ